MKKVFAAISFCWIFLLLDSCKKELTGFEISAKLSGFEENSKVILADATSGKILDSTRFSENKFKLTGKLEDSPSNLNLFVPTENGQGRKYSIIFIGNEKILIDGDREDFQYGLSVTGSKYHNFKRDFAVNVSPLENTRKEKLQQMFSLRQEGKWNDSLQSAFWSEDGIITKIDNQILEETKDFIEQNTNSYYALYQLVLNKTKLPKDFITQQINKLNPDFKNSKYVMVLENFMQNKMLETNDKFYDFNAENQNGQTVNFSDFFHNESYILLEFYSPYCDWCTRALPEISELAKSKKDKLEVVTFSIDKNKEDWLEDYKSNDKDWTSLWSKNGRYGDAYTKYGVYGTPAYFLFNENGILLGKWNGYDKKTFGRISSFLE